MEDDNTRTFVVLSPGTRVSHYEIIQKIGAGGMGEVYLAEDTSLHRRVALKFLPSHCAQDEDLKKRFVREAEASASLNHPNVITVHEVGDYQGRPFFAMELVEGQSLREFTKAKQVSIERIVELALQVLDGLKAAHEKGVVHRDIKPSNILIDSYGRPKILDFGLAAVKGCEQLTRTGSTMGTVQYMSPEQTGGGEVDHRSDLFSLGVVLYELITDRSPFARENDMATGQAILNDTPDPLARFRSGVPDRLQSIITKLLQKDWETRYQTAAGAMSDFKLLARETGADTLPRGSQARPATGRKRRYWLPASLVVLIAVTVLVLQPWKLEFSRTQEAIASENRIAIMYFENMADPTDSLRLGEIITNLLITDLSESEYVYVVSSQRLYDILKQMGREGQKHVDRGVATQVAERAGARLMLLGSIVRTAPSYLVTSQLVDVTTGDAVAAQRVEGKPDETVFPLIDSLTVAIKADLSLPTVAMEELDPSIAEVTTDSEEAYRYFVQAMDYFNKLYWNDAEVYFRKAVDADSNFVMANLFLYAAFAEQHEKNALWARIEQNSDKASKKERLWIEWVRALLIDHDVRRAVAIQESIVENFPDDKDGWADLGAYQRAYLRRYEDAKASFEKVLELDPANAWAYNMLAYVYDDLGQYEKAVWAATKYLELAPDEANPYDTRADIYAFNGLLSEALELYETASAIKRDYTGWKKPGFIHMYLGNLKAADSIFRVIASGDDWEDRADGRRYLAYLSLYQGKSQEALERLSFAEETLEMEGHSSSEQMASVLIEQANTLSYLNLDLAAVSQKLTAADKIMSKLGGPDSAMSLAATLGYNAMYCGRLGNAEQIDSLRDYLATYPLQFDQRFNEWIDFARGQLEYESGNAPQSVEHFAKLNKSTSDFRARFLLARSLLEANELGEAVEMFELALKRYDRSRDRWPIYAATVHYYAGRAYEQSGWDRKAIAQYEKFLDIWKDADPGVEFVDDARERLARLQGRIG